MGLYTFNYTINKSDNNFINGLAAYGKRVFIEQINGGCAFSRDEQFSCDKLPGLLSRLSGETVTIEGFFNDSESTFNVLPKLDTKKLLSEISEEIIKNPPTAIEQNKQLISARLEGLIYNNTGFNYRDPAPLNKQEAILLLSQLQEEKYQNYPDGITGAMHFPKHQIILFQFNFVNFILKYGSRTTLNEMCPLALNMDRGFLIDPHATKEDRLVFAELQKHFKAWKEKNYEGELIPANNSGFNSHLCMIREPSNCNPNAIPMHENPSLCSSQNAFSFWHMPSKAALLTAASVAALATVAGISYVTQKLK